MGRQSSALSESGHSKSLERTKRQQLCRPISNYQIAWKSAEHRETNVAPYFPYPIGQSQ
jgi:hypothetical protein